MKKTVFFFIMFVIGLALAQPSAAQTEYPSPPSPSINTPVDGSTFMLGETIIFTGYLTQQGSLVWTSSLDGIIGDGNYFSRNDLSVGTHIITLTASIQEGGLTLYGTNYITITITGPTPTIISPNDEGTFAAGTPVSFNGSVNSGLFDLVWYSDVDDYLGTGANLTLQYLTPGRHIITLVAQYVVGDKTYTASTQITITITGYYHTSQFAGSEYATFDLLTKILYIPYLDIQYPVIETPMWIELKQKGFETVTQYVTDDEGNQTSEEVDVVTWHLVGYGVQESIGNRDLYAVYHMLNYTLYVYYVDVDGYFYNVEFGQIITSTEGDDEQAVDYPLKFHITAVSYAIPTTQ